MIFQEKNKYSILPCGSVDDNSQESRHKRYFAFYVFSVLLTIVVTGIGLNAILFKNITSLGIIRLFLAVCVVANMVFVRLSKKIDIGVHFFLILLILQYALTLYGEPGHTGGILWIFLYPPFAISLQKCKRAFFWLISVFLLLVLSIILHETGIVHYASVTTSEILHILFVMAGLGSIIFLLRFIEIISNTTLDKKKKEENEVFAGIQLDLAEKIQRSFIPVQDLVLEECDIAFFYKAAFSVGGDYLDYFIVDDDRIGLVVSDVAGKGVPAALMMVSVRTIIKSMISEGMDDPEKMIRILNSMICSDYGGDFFVTFAFIVFNRKNNTIRFYNAGHSPFIYYSQIENRIKEEELRAYPIGLFENRNESNYIYTQLFKGDIVLLFSDGLTDTIHARNNQKARSLLFAEIIKNSDKSAAEIKDILVKKFVENKSEESVRDDISLIILKVKKVAYA